MRESAEQDVYDSIKERIDSLSQKEKADESVYLHRLSECKKCDHLISGVCMKCGCYVEFRAAFLKQKCPDVSDRKW